MLKKILGIFCMAIGLFLTLSGIAQVFKLVASLLTNTQQNSPYSFGYIAGQGMALLLSLAIAFFLIKYGIKWFKAKK